MKTNTNNIAYLVDQVKEKDSQSFAMLYEETYQKIFFFALTTLQNQEEAQEAVQEIYIKILSSIHSLKNENLFVPWAYKVAYSVCTRIVGSKKIHLSEESLENEDAKLEELTLAITNIKHKSMAKAVLSLDDSLRSTLLLTYYHSLMPKDIALIMSCPEGTVRRRLKAARNQLKKVLAEKKQLTLYTAIPIAIAMGSAAGSGLSTEKAIEILQATLTANKFSTKIDFTPHGVYKGTAEIQKASHRNFILGLFSTLIILLFGVIFSLDPEIWAIYPSATNYVQGMDLEFTVKSALPLKSVYLTSESGEKIDLTKVNQRTYRASIKENGTYKAHATSITRKTTEQAITVANLDNLPPSILEYTLDNDILTVELRDLVSGINFEKIYLEGTNRTRLEPIKIDEGKVFFEITEKNYILNAYDKADNKLESQINIVE